MITTCRAGGGCTGPSWPRGEPCHADTDKWIAFKLWSHEQV